MSKKIILITILLAIMLFTQFSNIIYASTIDTSRKATLTIIEYENAYGTDKNSSENVPLSGVDITIYKVDDANFNLSAQEIETKISQGTITLPSQTLTTLADGKVIFNNLDLGRYLVCQTNSPKNVNVKMESFLVDLPRTSDDGTSWNYAVTVEPKNVTVYGDVLLTKTGANSVILQGTTWELQVKNSTNNWEKYDYSGTLTTNKDGQISLTNLPAGKYRFVETGTLEGYILDSSNTHEFDITTDHTTETFTATNEKPSINKQVKIDNGYGKAVGAYSTDSVEWKVTADIPSMINKMDTYYISDQLPKELDFVSNSFAVYADNSLLSLNTDYTLNQIVNENEKTLKVEFTNSTLSGHNSIYFTYQTTFNSSVEYGKAITNSATLTYTNNIDVNGQCKSSITSNASTAEVHTGALAIQKIDTNFNPLQGAKFKISKTYEDAKNKIYIKDLEKETNKQSDDEDTDLIGISGPNGYLTFYGLKYGNDNVSASDASSSYFITEIESPTYQEGEETKHYQLLADSMEVTVNSTSGNESSTGQKVMNKKEFTLPITGATGTLSLAAIGGLIVLVALKRNKKNEEIEDEED